MALAALSRARRVAPAPPHSARGGSRRRAGLAGRGRGLGDAAHLAAAAPASIPVRPTKLEVSLPSGRLEQEADRVAEVVERMPESSVAAPMAPSVQRMCTACEGEALRSPAQAKEGAVKARRAPGPAPEPGPGLAARISDLRGGGKPLPATARGFFEPRFGHDFSQVRIHADGQAPGLAGAIGARAFAVGRDLVFGRGEYAPATSAGRRLIAHELTHVVHQTGRREPVIQRQSSAELSTTEGQLLPAPPRESIGLGSAQPECIPAGEIYEVQATMPSGDPACSTALIKDLRKSRALPDTYRAEHPLVGDDPCPGSPGVVDASYWLDDERRIVQIDGFRVTVMNACGDEEVLPVKGRVLGRDEASQPVAPSAPSLENVIEDSPGGFGSTCAVRYDNNCDTVEFTDKDHADTPCATASKYKWDAATDSYVSDKTDFSGTQITKTPGQLERFAGIVLKVYEDGKWVGTRCGDHPSWAL